LKKAVLRITRFTNAQKAMSDLRISECLRQCRWF